MPVRNLFDPESGMKKFGSGINIPDPQHWLCIWLTCVLGKLGLDRWRTRLALFMWLGKKKTNYLVGRAEQKWAEQKSSTVPNCSPSSLDSRLLPFCLMFLYQKLFEKLALRNSVGDLWHFVRIRICTSWSWLTGSGSNSRSDSFLQWLSGSGCKKVIFPYFFLITYRTCQHIIFSLKKLFFAKILC